MDENKIEEQSGGFGFFVGAIVIVVLVWLGIVSAWDWYSDWNKAEEVAEEYQGPELYDCPVPGMDGWDFQATDEECKRKQKEAADRLVKKEKAADAICAENVWIYGELSCPASHREYSWDSDKEAWVEDIRSKQCAEFAMVPKSELPVICLDYFGVNEEYGIRAPDEEGNYTYEFRI